MSVALQLNANAFGFQKKVPIMYAEIKAAVDSVKVISTILSASKDLRNFNELASAVSEVYEKLITATTAVLASQEKEAALSERIRHLEQEKIQHENWDAESKDYTLQEVGMGVFAYVYKPIMETMKPRHWVCAPCFENHYRSILQLSRGVYTCHHCGTSIKALNKQGVFVSIEDAYKPSQ